MIICNRNIIKLNALSINSFRFFEPGLASYKVVGNSIKTFDSNPLISSLLKTRSYHSLNRISIFKNNNVVWTRGKKESKKRNSDFDNEYEEEHEEHVVKKGKKPTKSTKSSSSQADDDDGEYDLGIKNTKDLMEKALKNLQNILSSIKLGKAEPSQISNIMVDGVALQKISQIHVRDPFTLSIQLYDGRMAPKVIKNIMASNSSLKPFSSNETITVPIPKPTPEHRKALVKSAHDYAEKMKIEIRNIRRDSLAAMKKAGLTKDEMVAAEKQIQDAHDKYVKNVDRILKTKEQEINK